jgi:two-component system response regulator AtoC
MKELLIVDDDVAIRTALEVGFRRAGWITETASCVQEALFKFRNHVFPLVITDVKMPDGTGLELLDGIRNMAPLTAVILLTAHGDVGDAVRAMRGGALDYLIKPVSMDQILHAAEAIIAPARAEKRSEDIVGQSPAIRNVVERAIHIAKASADVLVQAESGTGKEMLARLIHQNSNRSKGPFIAVNCIGFPETLLESELFGHVRGAFTGAMNSRQGRFELANGGTLLLDEIGELPLNLQPKLLRVLQERQVDRLGDTRSVSIDVRVIATTNRNLMDLVREGKFRADLYYRLNVVPLRLPPVRERREDIASLAEHFVRKHASAGQRPKLSPELVQRLAQYDWPGNVRELENFMRRLLAMSTSPVLGVELLEETELDQAELVAAAAVAAPMMSREAGRSLRDVERQLFEETLRASGGNRTKTAQTLGISVRTVRNKINEYGLRGERLA